MENNDFLGQIRQQFALGGQEISSYSPLVLAYLGDSVYEIIIRTILVDRRNCPVQKLHHEAIRYVKAAAQARMAEALLEHLSEDEKAVYLRGRNAKPHTVPKNADVGDYHKATGFEALVGYWYLTGQNEHMLQMIAFALGEAEKKTEVK